jgi:hypothetical protein
MAVTWQQHITHSTMTSVSLVSGVRFAQCPMKRVSCYVQMAIIANGLQVNQRNSPSSALPSLFAQRALLEKMNVLVMIS